MEEQVTPAEYIMFTSTLMSVTRAMESGMDKEMALFVYKTTWEGVEKTGLKESKVYLTNLIEKDLQVLP